MLDSLTSGDQWQMVGHPTEVSTLALQHDGCVLASASPAHSDWSCELRVWSVETRKCVKVISCFSTDNKHDYYSAVLTL